VYLDEVGVTAAGLAAFAWSEDMMLASMDKYAVETAIPVALDARRALR